MKLPVQRLLFLFSSLFTLSFLTNFFWESWHGFSLYQGQNVDAGEYVPMIMYMSLGDAVTILGMYVIMGLWAKDIEWVKDLEVRPLYRFFLLGLIVSALAEYWAVYVTHDWSYNERMPLILGIGWSPFVQISVTGLISLWVSQRIIFKSMGS